MAERPNPDRPSDDESLRFDNVLAEVETQAEERLNDIPALSPDSPPSPERPSRVHERLGKLSPESRQAFEQIRRIHDEIQRRIEDDPETATSQEHGPTVKELWGAAERNLSDYLEGKIPAFGFDEKNLELLTELARILESLPPAPERNTEKSDEEKGYDRQMETVGNLLNRLALALERREGHPNWEAPAQAVSRLSAEYVDARQKYLDGRMTGPAFNITMQTISSRATEIQHSTPGLSLH